MCLFTSNTELQALIHPGHHRAGRGWESHALPGAQGLPLLLLARLPICLRQPLHRGPEADVQVGRHHRGCRLPPHPLALHATPGSDPGHEALPRGVCVQGRSAQEDAGKGQGGSRSRGTLGAGGPAPHPEPAEHHRRQDRADACHLQHHAADLQVDLRADLRRECPPPAHRRPVLSRDAVVVLEGPCEALPARNAHRRCDFLQHALHRWTRQEALRPARHVPIPRQAGVKAVAKRGPEGPPAENHEEPKKKNRRDRS
ncbi:hypothetical protein BP6252_05102 [Coleophoma cylindrospora]|uniref:Uncharacterized protein n=1 Tax=Coleophoma cylindrospora TaxID=1849047 RepID=A0A3D8RSN0_9HELO|nr:hypothetical protein BP6252_05102 [Coleophoma cylindrospora]